jgi:hypothetical protein
MNDIAGPHIVKTFHEALDILDQSEPTIRDLIEGNLKNPMSVNKTQEVSKAMLSRGDLSKQVALHRYHHIKAAFRHLRDNLPIDPAIDGEEPKNEPPRIYGQSLASWARGIATQDAKRIHSAISVGLTSGEDNTDIAHRVIGSRSMNGCNGMTEVTRQHILSLGRGLLSKRKTRMVGFSQKE